MVREYKGDYRILILAILTALLHNC